MQLNSPISSENLMQSRLGELGLQSIDVDGAGDCFFRSVSHQLYGNSNHHMHIRTAGVQFMRDNPERFIESNTENSCVLTFFEAINCSTWSYVELSSLPLDKTKKTVIIVFIIHYRKFVWHMDDCSVICMSWVNLRDRVGKERWRQTLCDNRDNIFVWNNLPLNFTLL